MIVCVFKSVADIDRGHTHTFGKYNYVVSTKTNFPQLFRYLLFRISQFKLNVDFTHISQYVY